MFVQWTSNYLGKVLRYKVVCVNSLLKTTIDRSVKKNEIKIP